MMLSQLFFFIYGYILWPLLRSLSPIIGRCNAKFQAGLNMRKPVGGHSAWCNWQPKQRPIWIHCASGELEYAKPIITRLKREKPELKILVTYFSPTIAEAARIFPGVDFACPAPWDQPKALAEFLTWHKPRALLIARTDTWPEMLRSAHRFGLPTLLFAATLPSRSGRARGLGRWLSRVSFQYLDQIFCVDQEDLASFASLGFAARTLIAGDTRYDQVNARLAQPRPVRDELFVAHNYEQILVAGSTWEEDEHVLLSSAQALQKHLDFVFVPHEPTEAHLLKLEQQITQLGLKSVRYSSAQTWPLGTVLLVDQIGILAELYLKGRFAFVGGSFKKTVHSVMEPLAAGCITFVGPLHHNNREALEFKTIEIGRGFTCVQEITSSQSLTEKIERSISPKFTDSLDEMGRAIQTQVRRRSGQSDLVVGWCWEKMK